jgi:hypothetical protein
MTTSKLPEWAEKPAGSAYRGHSQWQDYFHCQSEAALARMEALVERIRGMHQVWVHPVECPRGRYTRNDEPPRDDICTCGLSELLAACARKEAGR